MAHRGHDVKVVYSSSDGLPPDDLPYRTVVVPHHERLYFNPLEFARAVFRVDERPDIIHSHGYEGAFLSSVVKKGTTLVATTHHPDPSTLIDKPSVSHPLAQLAWFRRRLIPLLERRALRSARLVVCICKHSAQTLIERGYLRSGTSPAVVYYGSDSFEGSEPAEAAGHLPPDIQFVCVARLDRHKGIDVLLRAVTLLGGCPQLDLLGIGPEETALRKLAQDLGLDRGVRFQGFVAPPLRSAFIKQATAVVLPSLAENFPRVILESLRAGVPIVATSVGGIPEAVENDKQALLVPPGDPAALAAALRRVRDDQALRQRLGIAAAARATEFTWERHAKQLEEVYASLLQGRDRSVHGAEGAD